MANRTWASTLFFVTLFTVSQPTLADEILFTNGDKLTGKITGIAGGKMTIETAVAGIVTVDMANVSTFSTDTPGELHLSDGSVVTQSITPATQPGSISTTGTDATAAQDIALTNIDEFNPGPVQWTGSVLAGALISRGNTNTDNINAGFDAVRTTEKDRLTFDGDYLFGRQKNADTGEYETTTHNWNVGGKYDYYLNEKLYWFASMRAERDSIASLDLRLTPSAGLGYDWIEQDNMHFTSEGGVAYVYEDFEEGGHDDHFALRIAYHFDRRINDKVNLFHNFEYLPSVEDIADFNINADAGIRVDLTANMFNEVKVEWSHDSVPAEDASEDDLRWIIGIGWTF